MDAEKWVVASQVKSYGDLGCIGVQVSVLLPRELTEKDRLVSSELMDKIKEALMEESLRLDPKRQEENRKECEAIMGLFIKPIFAREIPNGYCSQWCCKDRPWFEVFTTVGPIVIGWRKRVISIDWSKSTVTHLAQSLFPDEDVTKEGRLIHAWSYDKAREYISVLMAQGSSHEVQCGLRD